MHHPELFSQILDPGEVSLHDEVVESAVVVSDKPLRFVVQDPAVVELAEPGHARLGGVVVDVHRHPLFRSGVIFWAPMQNKLLNSAVVDMGRRKSRHLLLN